MPRLQSGTKKHPSRPTEVWMGSYTDQQLEKLEELKDERFALGIAHAKHVNHILHPDGTLTTDVDQVRKHIQEEVQTTSAALLKATREQRPAAREAANRAQNLMDEFEDHLEQKRFLFIVDDNGLPVVYFQAAVEGNPDTPILKAEDTPERRAKALKHDQEMAAKDTKLREHNQRLAKGAPARDTHLED